MKAIEFILTYYKKNESKITNWFKMMIIMIIIIPITMITKTMRTTLYFLKFFKLQLILIIFDLHQII